MRFAAPLKPAKKHRKRVGRVDVQKHILLLEVGSLLEPVFVFNFAIVMKVLTALTGL